MGSLSLDLRGDICHDPHIHNLPFCTLLPQRLMTQAPCSQMETLRHITAPRTQDSPHRFKDPFLELSWVSLGFISAAYYEDMTKIHKAKMGDSVGPGRLASGSKSYMEVPEGKMGT